MQNLKLANQSWYKTIHIIPLNQNIYKVYKVLKIINDTTILLIMPNGRERKTNINDVKPCSTTELAENAWDSFLVSIKAKPQNNSYNLRPQP